MKLLLPLCLAVLAAVAQEVYEQPDKYPPADVDSDC